MNCPNCHAGMRTRSFEQMYGRSEELDICHACQAIWFDKQELLQLSPGATLDLLSAIAESENAARLPIAPRLFCPRCGMSLVEVNDMQRTTRFSYFRCPAGHGRFLTFFQFLRAKNFVRSLATAEVRELRKHIRQVNCSNCGAPVDIERDLACQHCRTPVAIIDPDQVNKAVATLRAAKTRQETVDPSWPLAVAIERVRADRAFAEAEVQSGRADAASLLHEDVTDLIATGLRALRAVIR